MSKKYIHISFKTPIISNIQDLYFLPIIDHNILEFSYQKYIYKYNYDEYTYIFNGYFRDNYFLITLDIYNINLNNSIFNKNIILIDLSWELNNNNIYTLKINNQINTKCIVTSLRKELNTCNNFSLDELLNIKNNYNLKCSVKYSSKNTNIFNFFKNIIF